ncbi:MAG: siroheme synthase CysG [Candidatus Porifericomitaceae bacterium WSBS_2022_MAG_OTU9]
MKDTTGYPVFLDLKDKHCLVVGGGEVALRKTERLLKAEAKVTVVAPQLCPQLQRLAGQGGIVHSNKSFAAEDLAEMVLVVAATEKQDVNRQVHQAASTAGILINVVDNPGLCNFTTPAVIDRDPIAIAIGSGGAAPMLVRSLRVKLEAAIPSAYGDMARLMKDARAEVKQRYPDLRHRRRFWEMVLTGPVSELINSGKCQEAKAMLHGMLQQRQVTTTGEVYLVGGGPGDPDLLTFKAMRFMQQADIVIYDRLIAPEILDLVRRDAERIYVGKEKDIHTVPQEKINQYLVDKAKQGNRVLRLKGGDPFIFGRGGEEIEELASNHIPFHIVPGITAASGCAAYAGIPLTHRDYAHSCIFITGHIKEQKLQMNWDAIIQPNQTIAIYMGLHSLPLLCQELSARGMRSDMPAALIQQGTTKKQKVYVATIGTLPQIAEDSNIKPPSMIIIGEVVGLRGKLQPDAV